MFGTGCCWGGEYWSSGLRGIAECVANVNGGRSIKFAAS